MVSTPSCVVRSLHIKRHGWRLSAIWLVIIGGCLWTPDISERSEAASGPGPTIDRSLVDPSPDDVFELTSTTSFDVSAAISHPTIPPERLSYYWFLNYQAKALRAPYLVGSQQTVTLNPCVAKLKNIYGVADDGKEYPLELFVVDGTSGHVEIESLERKITGHYAYVRWTIKIPIGWCGQ